MQSSEVLESLSNIKGRVEAHLRNVKEYRAFLAIQAAMDEISHIGELVTPLEGVKDGVRQRLNDLREYRALLAVEKSIADIANVLGLLDEITPRPTPQESAAEPAASHLVAADAEHHEQPAAARPEPAPQPAAFTAAIAVPEIIAAPSPTDVAPTLPSSREVNVIVTPAQAAAGTAPFAASEAAGVTLATVFATYAPPVSETVVTSVEQDVVRHRRRRRSLLSCL